jgi:tRNA-dihydrouridine synthase B
MAGVTHSAFRRLLADLGGCGALYTEMLPVRVLPRENPEDSPAVMRRPGQPPLVYQLLAYTVEHVGPALKRLAALRPDAVDLNLGCPAPEVRRMGGGAALFRTPELLERILTEIRLHWDGTLIIKCRLGDPGEHWRDIFLQRLALFQRMRVDALVIHPRFSDEKLKRRARWEELDWVSGQTALPLIGNGDIACPADIARLHQRHPNIRAFMLGRIAAVRPWIFAQAAGETIEVDTGEIWRRMYRYIEEDFAPERRLGRIKDFTVFYARNFAFGHELYRTVQSSTTPEQTAERAQAFFATSPQLVNIPSIAAL